MRRAIAIATAPLYRAFPRKWAPRTRAVRVRITSSGSTKTLDFSGNCPTEAEVPASVFPDHSDFRFIRLRTQLLADFEPKEPFGPTLRREVRPLDFDAP